MKNILEIIGNTPIVKLQKIVPRGCGEIYLKLEAYNPTGSKKDRMALAMIEGAEKRGDLKSSWIEQTGRPDKKIYTISSQGLSALVLWLEMARTELTEDEVMLIVYNQGLIESEIVSTALNTYRYQCVREKSDLEERWLEYSDRKAGDESRLSHVRAVYEFAFKSRDARIAWCNQLIEGLINNEKARPLN